MSKPSYDELLERIKKIENREKKILWENPDPTKDFPAQTITFENPDNIEKVKLIVIFSKTHPIEMEYPMTLGKEMSVKASAFYTPSGKGYISLFYSDYFKTTSTTIEYPDRNEINGSSTNIVKSNDHLIPLRIEER